MDGILSIGGRGTCVGKVVDGNERGCQNMIELDMKAFQNMVNTLDNMGKDGEKVFIQALDAGASVILPVMKRRVYQVLHRRTGNLYENIKTGKVRKLKSGVYSQIVGISKGDISKAYYGKFSEYGSSHEPARPWIRPAFDESKDEAYQRIESTIADGVEKSFRK